MLTVSRSDFERQVITDEDPDASYLEQEGLGFEERLAEYRRGEFYFVGVRAKVTLHIPVERNTHILQEVTSPGLWGVESDSGEGYFNEVYAEEVEQLVSMLEQMGVKVETPARIVVHICNGIVSDVSTDSPDVQVLVHDEDTERVEENPNAFTTLWDNAQDRQTVERGFARYEKEGK